MKIFQTCFILVVLLASPLRAGLFSSSNSPDEVRAAIAKLPEHGKRSAKAALYTDLGFFLYKEGKMTDAAAAYEEALRNHTSRAQLRHIYLYMGKSYESSDRLDKAITAYEDAVLYDSKNWKRHRDLAFLYERTLLFDKAIKSYEKALKYNSKESSVIFSLGRTWRKMGFLDRAESRLVEALTLGFDPSLVSAELSLVYEGQGRYGDAAQAWLKKMNEKSSAEEWARVVYLAVLSNDKAMAEKGVKELKAKPGAKENTAFYSYLIEFVGATPDKAFGLINRNMTFETFVQPLK